MNIYSDLYLGHGPLYSRLAMIASLEYKGFYISLDSLQYLTIGENGCSQDA